MTKIPESGPSRAQPRPEGRRPRPPRDLLDGVRSRDPEALGEFFELYVDLLYGLALRLTGDVGVAQDVVQNVFVNVHRAADRLDPERDPAPWLTTITYNECRSLWRSRAWKMSQHATPIDADDELEGRLPADSSDPEGELLQKERTDRLQAAIQELPEDLRSVVVLHDYREMTHEEVATIVGATPAAVRKRYSRALARLREILGSESG